MDTSKIKEEEKDLHIQVPYSSSSPYQLQHSSTTTPGGRRITTGTPTASAELKTMAGSNASALSRPPGQMLVVRGSRTTAGTARTVTMTAEDVWRTLQHQIELDQRNLYTVQGMARNKQLSRAEFERYLPAKRLFMKGGDQSNMVEVVVEGRIQMRYTTVRVAEITFKGDESTEPPPINVPKTPMMCVDREQEMERGNERNRERDGGLGEKRPLFKLEPWNPIGDPETVSKKTKMQELVAEQHGEKEIQMISSTISPSSRFVPKERIEEDSLKPEREKKQKKVMNVSAKEDELAEGTVKRSKVRPSILEMLAAGSVKEKEKVVDTDLEGRDKEKEGEVIDENKNEERREDDATTSNTKPVEKKKRGRQRKPPTTAGEGEPVEEMVMSPVTAGILRSGSHGSQTPTTDGEQALVGELEISPLTARILRSRSRGFQNSPQPHPTSRELENPKVLTAMEKKQKRRENKGKEEKRANEGRESVNRDEKRRDSVEKEDEERERQQPLRRPRMRQQTAFITQVDMWHEVEIKERGESKGNEESAERNTEGELKH